MCFCIGSAFHVTGASSSNRAETKTRRKDALDASPTWEPGPTGDTRVPQSWRTTLNSELLIVRSLFTSPS